MTETWQIILYTLSSAIFISLLATGFGFILRSVKFFNVAYGGAFLVGGYIVFLFYRVLSISFFLSILLSILSSGLYMFLIYKFIFKPLLKRKATNFVLLITSFGILTATSSIIGMIFGNQATLAARHLSDINTINIFGAVLNIVQLYAISFYPIVIGILALLYYKTRIGRAIRAVEDDREMAELVGISTEKIFSIVFFIGGILAGLGGIGEVFDVGIVPSAGLFYMLPVIVVAVVGGMRSFWGGIISAFILVIAQKLTVVYIGGSWEQAVPFVVLIIVLLLKPEGILKR